MNTIAIRNTFIMIFAALSFMQTYCMKPSKKIKVPLQSKKNISCNFLTKSFFHRVMLEKKEQKPEETTQPEEIPNSLYYIYKQQRYHRLKALIRESKNKEKKKPHNLIISKSEQNLPSKKKKAEPVLNRPISRSYETPTNQKTQKKKTNKNEIANETRDLFQFKLLLGKSLLEKEPIAWIFTSEKIDQKYKTMLEEQITPKDAHNSKKMKLAITNIINSINAELEEIQNEKKETFSLFKIIKKQLTTQKKQPEIENTYPKSENTGFFPFSFDKNDADFHNRIS